MSVLPVVIVMPIVRCTSTPMPMLVRVARFLCVSCMYCTSGELSIPSELANHIELVSGLIPPSHKRSVPRSQEQKTIHNSYAQAYSTYTKLLTSRAQKLMAGEPLSDVEQNIGAIEDYLDYSVPPSSSIAAAAGADDPIVYPSTVLCYAFSR